MILAIIAGGKGTRLGLGSMPKPMAQVGGRPLLEQQIILAKSYGIRDVYILSGYQASILHDYFGDGKNLGLRITHLVEEQPLGTAGAIKLLKGIIKERFLVFYGDVVLDIDIQRMVDFDQVGGSLATLLVHPNDHPYDSDLVDIDTQHAITTFHSKPHPEGVWLRNLVNAGVYILDPAILDMIPSGVAYDCGRDLFPAVLRQGKTLRAYISAEYVKDMGTPERLAQAGQDFEKGKVAGLNARHRRPAIFLDRDGVINEERGNIFRAEDFHLIEGAAEAIQRINQSEYLCIVVTNQPVLAKGFCSAAELDRIHKKMDTFLGRNRAYIDGLFYCPHHPESGFPGEVLELKKVCECRKPKPGLILQAAEEFNIDLTRSWMIGDRDTDISAGQAAGVKTVMLGERSHQLDVCRSAINPDAHFSSLPEAISHIMAL